MGASPSTTVDPAPPNRELIEVRVAELKQLFNSMDASPFRERDLDPNAEGFIVGWAREAPHNATLSLLVHLERAQRPPGLVDEPAALRAAIREFFTHRAEVTRGRLHQLLRIGRISLLVGLAFLVTAVGLGDFVANAMKGRRLGELLREGLVICGWVAMWRPLELFVYGWWPIRAEAKLFDHLSAMPVRIEYRGSSEPGAAGAWRHDWPAEPPVQTTLQKSLPHSPALRSGGAMQTGSIAATERGPFDSAVDGERGGHVGTSTGVLRNGEVVSDTTASLRRRIQNAGAPRCARVHQSGVDEELFDVVAGRKALALAKSLRGVLPARRDQP